LEPHSSLLIKQHNVASDISGVKTAVRSQFEAFTKKIAQLEQQVSAFYIPKEFQGKTIAETTLPLKDKVIALTFDDGPWPRTTEQVLEILKQNDIKATFFWIGNNLKKFPQIGKLVVEAGHSIGNHTWHHWYHQMNPSTAAREIEDTAALIYKTTGVKTSLFRPPGGFLNNGPADYARKKNYAVMMWSADSRDWFYRLAPAQVLVNLVLKDAQPGGIVLMHDGGGDRSNTVRALPQIIAELRKRGYKFVTVPELLDMKDRELKLASAR
jgi:chitin deacetylase